MKEKPISDQLIDQLERYPSLDKLHVQRNLGLGAGLAAFVLLLAILEAGVDSFALKASLFAAAIAVPLLVGMAGLVEYYIVLGPKSYGHRRTTLSKNLLGSLLVIGGVGLTAATAGVLYHLLPYVAYAFGASIAVAVLAAALFHWHLARWYFGNRGAHET